MFKKLKKFFNFPHFLNRRTPLMIDAKIATNEFRLEQWRVIIQDRINSGLLVDDYCEQHNLSRNSYYYWLRKIKQDMLIKQSTELVCQNKISTEPSIVELQPPKSDNCTDPNRHLSQVSLEAQLLLSIDGVTITVSDRTSDELLTRVLKAVRYAK